MSLRRIVKIIYSCWKLGNFSQFQSLSRFPAPTVNFKFMLPYAVDFWMIGSVTGFIGAALLASSILNKQLHIATPQR
jgi:hypothetical protein